MSDGRPIAPTCCANSREHGVVQLWLTTSGFARWCARPYETNDKRLVHSVAFCPFCGSRISADHVPLELEPPCKKEQP